MSARSLGARRAAHSPGCCASSRPHGSPPTPRLPCPRARRFFCAIVSARNLVLRRRRRRRIKCALRARAPHLAAPLRAFALRKRACAGCCVPRLTDCPRSRLVPARHLAQCQQRGRRADGHPTRTLRVFFVGNVSAEATLSPPLPRPLHGTTSSTAVPCRVRCLRSDGSDYFTPRDERAPRRARSSACPHTSPVLCRTRASSLCSR